MDLDSFHALVTLLDDETLEQYNKVLWVEQHRRRQTVTPMGNAAQQANTTGVFSPSVWSTALTDAFTQNNLFGTLASSTYTVTNKSNKGGQGNF